MTSFASIVRFSLNHSALAPRTIKFESKNTLFGGLRVSGNEP